MGGRAAEKNTFNKISTGAQSDLDQVTKMAYSMVAIYGMNEKVGNVSFYGMQQDQFNKPYSDDTARLIDQECRKMIDEQYGRAQALLKERSKELHLLAAALLDKEVLTKADVARLIGDSPYKDKNRPLVSGKPPIIPETPTVETPTVETPTVETPTVETPTVESPSPDEIV
jgi:cell division protease FtsH